MTYTEMMKEKRRRLEEARQRDSTLQKTTDDTTEVAQSPPPAGTPTTTKPQMNPHKPVEHSVTKVTKTPESIITPITVRSQPVSTAKRSRQIRLLITYLQLLCCWCY